MAILLSLLALAAAPAEPTEPAPPQALVAAVQSCSGAVTGRTRVDHAALEAEGWKEVERRGEFLLRRKAGNPALIIANRGEAAEFPGNLMQEVCMVRARVDAATAKAAADRFTTLTGVAPTASPRVPDKFFWRGASVWIGQEPFDRAVANSPITQIMVMPAAKPRSRPTPDASSQNKNQEPR